MCPLPYEVIQEVMGCIYPGPIECFMIYFMIVFCLGRASDVDELLFKLIMVFLYE